MINWVGTITVDKDAAGNYIATFVWERDKDKKPYNIQIDEQAKDILKDVKTGSHIQLKGKLVTRGDGTAYIVMNKIAINFTQIQETRGGQDRNR